MLRGRKNRFGKALFIVARIAIGRGKDTLRELTGVRVAMTRRATGICAAKYADRLRRFGIAVCG